MTDPGEITGATRHLLRPSIPGTVPPLPDRGGERLRISLGFVRRDAEGMPRARVYAYPDPPSDDETTQFDDLGEGDHLRVRGWDLTIEEIFETDVLLALAPGDGDA